MSLMPVSNFISYHAHPVKPEIIPEIIGIREFCIKGRNSRVETGEIKDAELNDVISFEI